MIEPAHNHRQRLITINHRRFEHHFNLIDVAVTHRTRRGIQGGEKVWGIHSGQPVGKPHIEPTLRAQLLAAINQTMPTLAGDAVMQRAERARATTQHGELTNLATPIRELALPRRFLQGTRPSSSRCQIAHTANPTIVNTTPEATTRWSR